MYENSDLSYSKEKEMTNQKGKKSCKKKRVLWKRLLKK